MHRRQPLSTARCLSNQAWLAGRKGTITKRTVVLRLRRCAAPLRMSNVQLRVLRPSTTPLRGSAQDDKRSTTPVRGSAWDDKGEIGQLNRAFPRLAKAH